jgi:hypothetical protein
LKACLSVRRTGLVLVLLLWLSIGLRSLAGSETLFEVVDDIVNVLSSDRDTDEVLSDTRVVLLLVAELLVGGGPGVDRKGL